MFYTNRLQRARTNLLLGQIVILLKPENINSVVEYKVERVEELRILQKKLVYKVK